MLPKRYYNKSVALLAFVIIISAFTGYRIGLSNQSMLMSLPQYSTTNNNHYTTYSTSSSSSTATLHKLTQIASTARSNSINESELPYSCGVLLYYHVPCTGGSTMNNYLLDHSTQRNGTAEYFTFWGGEAESKPLERRERTQRIFIDGVDQLVQNVSSDNGGGWRIVHLHHSSFHLNESESILSNWRNVVESKGCHFVASILFREALMHSLALHKYSYQKNISREEWISHLAPSDSSQTSSNRLSPYGYETQLDYFLYNKIVRNPYLVSAQEKVDRALELLSRHFDIISVGEHEKFKERIQQFTGWDEDDNEEMERKNTYRGTIHFTKREVENLQKLLDANGDIDFIEKVKLLFGSTTST